MSKPVIPKLFAALLVVALAALYVGSHSVAKVTAAPSEPTGQMLPENQALAGPRFHGPIVRMTGTAVAHEAVGQPPCTWAPQVHPGDACGLCGNGGPGTGKCTKAKLQRDVAWCARASKSGSKAYRANSEKCRNEAIFLAALGRAPKWYAGCIGGAATGARFIEGEPWNSLVGCLVGVGFAYVF